MSNETTTIGGIVFNSNDVISVSSKRSGSVNMKPLFEYTVETKFGTFKYNDNELHRNSFATENGKLGTIFQRDNGQVTVNNCDLKELKGTNRKDNFLVNDSAILMVNTKGDYGNCDSITITGKSELYIGKTDTDDVTTDMTVHGAPSQSEPIQKMKINDAIHW